MGEEPLAIVHGCVYEEDLLYIAAVDPVLEDENVYHGYVMRWKQGEWGHWKVENRICALGAYDISGVRTVFAMGPDGRVHVTDKNGFHWEEVDTEGDGPSQRRALCCLRKIGDYIYTAGMSRMVYRRSLRGTWESASDGALVRRSSTEVTGFLGIDGFDSGDIYAVGFHGHIWHFDKTRWRQCVSPTSKKLTCVRCTETKQVFAAGAGGLILRGRQDTWEIIQQNMTEEDFSGMEYAFGSLFLATRSGEVFRLDGNELVRVNINLNHSVTTGTLHYANGLLLSVGTRDIYVFDGSSWNEIVHP